MPVFVFTFGYNHKDKDGGTLGGKFAEVLAIDEMQARAKMYSMRGPKWAFTYPTKLAAGVARFGLTKVPLEKVILPEGER